jgi:hypothetical protein
MKWRSQSLLAMVANVVSLWSLGRLMVKIVKWELDPGLVVY